MKKYGGGTGITLPQHGACTAYTLACTQDEVRIIIDKSGKAYKLSS